MIVQTERLLREFMELVQIPGLPFQEGRVAEAICHKLDELRIPYEVDRAGESRGGQTGNVIARLPGNVAGAMPIAFAAHMDVVAPLDGMVPELRDGRVVSDGDHILGSDNRSAVAGVLELVRVLQERRLAHGPIELLFTIDEEGRMTGARELDLARLQARYIFTPDNDNPAGLERHGAHYVLSQLDFFGKAAHALLPAAGINAIQMAATALARLPQGEVAPGTTLNFGTIRGGQAENIVPHHVAVVGELRGLDREAIARQQQRIREACEAAARELGGRAETHFIHEFEGYRLAPNDPLVAMVERAMWAAGLEPVDLPGGGNSESNVFNARGVPSISLGTGAYNAHGHDEFTPVADLVKSVEIYLALADQARCSSAAS